MRTCRQFSAHTAIRRVFWVTLAVSLLLLFYIAVLPGEVQYTERIPANFSAIKQKFTFGNVTLKVVAIGQNADKNDKKAISTPGEATCRIPKLDKNNPEIMAFDKEPHPLNCNGEPHWFELDMDNKLVLTARGETIKSNGSFKCTVAYFEREDDDHVKWEPEKQVQVGDKIDHSDYSLLKCEQNGKVWERLFMNIVPRKELIQKSADAKPSPDWSGLNLFFMGFDSLSQQAYRRSLPKTVEFLEKELGSIILDGYNIVGDGTPQAFIPILTGQTEEELPMTRKRVKGAQYVDEVYPFVWKNYSDAGYVTVYGEDAAAVGTFTYRLKGFKHQPADHYTRTFFQYAEKYAKNIKCDGPETQHKVWFKYAEDFMHKYPKDTKKFLLMFHALLSHNDINEVKLADEEFRDLLKRLKTDGYFDDALVVIMADHGNRFADVRATQQGQLEERLPFMSFALPEKFKQTEKGRLAYENLKKNKDRLTSPFDLHPTLMNILKFPSVEELNTVQDAKENRALSLFREIPENRTCAQAGIASHWCTCLNWEEAYTTQEQKDLSNLLALGIVKTMNEYTAKERSLCAEIHLAEVLSAKRLIPNTDLMKYNGVKDQDGFVPQLQGKTKATFFTYQIKLNTQPGNAIYEATVNYDEVAKELTVDYRSISHVNKFGDLPHCIIDKNYFLAAYCVCNDKIL
ncbi:unnamed protein product [Bursaphelenchus okinawaensis]|uniref:DUF229 domain-containing protein n=1 Tax=Bursaphelenchus okinawaensis TaxID=465554 RepID=A0A811KYV0_9BILA|nr:unnamed protein product [Bursaphelenchus okinawaensis]CAG9114480.1 unnamed protein product [Bursaphelenchus okinawaensis]